MKKEVEKEVDEAKNKVSEAANNLAGKRNFEAAGKIRCYVDFWTYLGGPIN